MPPPMAREIGHEIKKCVIQKIKEERAKESGSSASQALTVKDDVEMKEEDSAVAMIE